MSLKLHYWHALDRARQYRASLDARLEPWLCPLRQRFNHGCYAVDIHAKVGLFAQLNWCLTILAHCERTGRRPAIELSSPFYARTPGEDWFKLFFDLPRLTAEDRRRLADGTIKPCRITSIEQAGLPPDLEAGLSLRSAHRLLHDYVQIKPEILAQLDAFMQQHLGGKNVVGVHYRGTDKGSEAPPVTRQQCLAAVERYLDANPHIQAVFLASDEAAFIDWFVAHCRVEVVAHDDQMRSRNGEAVHVRPGAGDNSIKAREALVNCLLLSRCQALIRTASFLSAWASVFNPDLPVVMLNRPYAGTLWFPDREIVNQARMA